MKKLFLISDTNYVRNFLATGAFDHIIEEGDAFAASAHVGWEQTMAEKYPLIGRIHYSPAVSAKHAILADVLMVRHRKRSTAFSFRFGRYLSIFRHSWQRLVHKTVATSPNFEHFPGPFKAVFILFQLLRFHWQRTSGLLQRACELTTIKVCGRPVLAELYQCCFQLSTNPNSDLEKIISEFSPQCIFLPTNAIDPMLNDVLRLRSKHGYKVVLLVDNWDNLSSKTVFLQKPDHLLVWGEQSAEHARDIHGIARKSIHIAGTPRFDYYLSSLNASTPPESPYPFSYALFTGCAIAFDETTALVKLEHFCNSFNASSKQPIKVVYRPHPWRQSRIKEKRFDEKRFKHVILDQQVREQYLTHKGVDRDFQPDMTYYPPLLANAMFVIGPLTTMLIEASLFRKQILALAYDDGIHHTSPHRAYRCYPHFRGIEDIPGFSIIHHLSDLPAKFAEAITGSCVTLDESKHAKAMSYFLHRDENPYSVRLQKIMREICSKE